MIAHFIVSTVSGVMIAICGETIAPRQITGSSVGQQPGANICPECLQKATDGWVTFRFPE
jgi:hypothetical protein